MLYFSGKGCSEFPKKVLILIGILSNILAGAVILVLAGALVVNAIPSIIALFSAGAGTVFGLLIQAL